MRITRGARSEKGARDGEQGMRSKETEAQKDSARSAGGNQSSTQLRSKRERESRGRMEDQKRRTGLEQEEMEEQEVVLRGLKLQTYLSYLLHMISSLVA